MPDCKSLTVKELQELAKKRGVKYTGLRKAELCAALGMQAPAKSRGLPLKAWLNHAEKTGAVSLAKLEKMSDRSIVLWNLSQALQFMRAPGTYSPAQILQRIRAEDQGMGAFVTKPSNVKKQLGGGSARDKQALLRMLVVMPVAEFRKMPPLVVPPRKK